MCKEGMLEIVKHIIVVWFTWLLYIKAANWPHIFSFTQIEKEQVFWKYKRFTKTVNVPLLYEGNNLGSRNILLFYRFFTATEQATNIKQ